MNRILAVLSLFLCTWGLSLQAQNYIVLFKQTEVSVASLDHTGYQNLLQDANKKSIDSLNQWIGGTHGNTKAASVTDLWLVRGAMINLSDADAKTLSGQPFVQGIYPDTKHQMIHDPVQPKATKTHDTPDLTNLWGLNRIGIYKLRAAMPNLNGAGVNVGVIDTGIQSGHPEFFGTLPSLTFKDFVNNISSPYDDMGHGTHVSGTIAGNQVGIAPQVSLYSAKALNALGEGYDSWLIEAMQWMFNPSGDPTSTAYPRVVSCSWGMDLFQDGNNISAFLPYELALEAWVNGGIVPVFAAGNAGMNPNGIPGGLPEAIAVGAIAQGDTVAPFSSLGPNMWQIGQMVLTLSKPDISAPGVAITSSYPPNTYVTWDGTSMATPHVTGTIALMLQANPKLAYADVKQILELNSDLKLDNAFGYGIDNAYNAVMAAINGPANSSKKKLAVR